MKKIFKITSFLFLSFYSKASLATMGMMDQADAFVNTSGLDAGATDSTLADSISMIIKAFLGLLGIIFIVLVVWSGYDWMTAGGNEDKVTKAKSRLTRAIIGLLIIISAYAITYFVFGALDGATSGP